MIQGRVEEIKKTVFFKNFFSFFSVIHMQMRICDKLLPLVGICGIKFCILLSYLKSKAKQNKQKTTTTFFSEDKNFEGKKSVEICNLTSYIL